VAKTDIREKGRLMAASKSDPDNEFLKNMWLNGLIVSAACPRISSDRTPLPPQTVHFPNSLTQSKTAVKDIRKIFVIMLGF